MSKFDLLAHGELNRYSALNLKIALGEHIISKDKQESVNMVSSQIIIRLEDNVKRAFLDPSVHRIIVTEDAVFIVRLAVPSFHTLSVGSVVSELQDIDKNNDRALVIIDLSTKMMHQVLDHACVNVSSNIASRAANTNKFAIIVDQGDPMSDELATMWLSLKDEK